MRSTKTVLGLFLLVVGLIGLWLFQRYQANRPVELDAYRQQWATFDQESLTMITVATPAASLQLVRESDNWQTNHYPVNGVKMDELVTVLHNPQQVTLVSDNPEQQDALGISSTSATLTLTYPTGEKKVILGQTAQDGRYVKLDRQNEVYLVSGFPTAIDSVALTDWVDPVIVRINQPSIKLITVTTGAQAVMIKKTEAGWVNAQDQVLDTTPFNSMLLTLESFATQGLLSTGEQLSLPKVPGLMVQVDRQEGAPIKLKFYTSKELSAVEVEGQPGIYKLGPATLKYFELNPEDLKSKS